MITVSIFDRLDQAIQDKKLKCKRHAKGSALYIYYQAQLRALKSYKASLDLDTRFWRLNDLTPGPNGIVYDDNWEEISPLM